MLGPPSYHLLPLLPSASSHWKTLSGWRRTPSPSTPGLGVWRIVPSWWVMQRATWPSAPVKVELKIPCHHSFFASIYKYIFIWISSTNKKNLELFSGVEFVSCFSQASTSPPRAVVCAQRPSWRTPSRAHAWLMRPIWWSTFASGMATGSEQMFCFCYFALERFSFLHFCLTFFVSVWFGSDPGTHRSSMKSIRHIMTWVVCFNLPPEYCYRFIHIRVFLYWLIPNQFIIEVTEQASTAQPIWSWICCRRSFTPAMLPVRVLWNCARRSMSKRWDVA